jgi:pyruvate dehydrogenase complex dehydrogenase (E1) component
MAILLYYSLFPATLFVIDNNLQSLDTGVTNKARPTVNTYEILEFNL